MFFCKIHGRLEPNDICPFCPEPAADPKLAAEIDACKEALGSISDLKACLAEIDYAPGNPIGGETLEVIQRTVAARLARLEARR